MLSREKLQSWVQLEILRPREHLSPHNPYCSFWVDRKTKRLYEKHNMAVMLPEERSDLYVVFGPYRDPNTCFTMHIEDFNRQYIDVTEIVESILGSN